MNLREVLQQFKQAHREIENDTGHEPDRVSDEICPLDALPGFDSPLIPNVIRAVAKGVGVTLPPGTRLKNCYVQGGRKLKLSEVAERFIKLYGNGISTP